MPNFALAGVVGFVAQRVPRAVREAGDPHSVPDLDEDAPLPAALAVETGARDGIEAGRR